MIIPSGILADNSISRQGSASVFQITCHKNLNGFHRVRCSHPNVSRPTLTCRLRVCRPTLPRRLRPARRERSPPSSLTRTCGLPRLPKKSDGAVRPIEQKNRQQQQEHEQYTSIENHAFGPVLHAWADHEAYTNWVAERLVHGATRCREANAM
jgi:hypothetical protein